MRILFLSLIIFFGISNGCDVIEEPFKKENIQITTEKKILLEYYTGHRCNSCPGAPLTIYDILDVYPGNVIVITVHAGPLAKLLVPPTDYDFTTETGDDWYTFFGFEGVPNGMLNRVERSGTRIIPHANWASVAAELLEEPVMAEIIMDASFNETTRNIQVDVQTNILSYHQEKSYFINVVLVEDSIVKPQLNQYNDIGPVPVILDYVHNSVLRHSLTGSWGAAINPAIIANTSRSMVLNPNSDIVPENCHIVAFISDCSYNVIQAEKIKLTD